MEFLSNVETDKDKLLRLLVRTGAFQYSPDKPFALASGKTSPYYFDLRLLNGDPEGINAIAVEFYNRIRQMPDIKSVGGLESGSISIATAIAQLSWIEHRRDQSSPLISSFFVRKEQKKHGTRRLIEGRCSSSTVVIDDVVTSGMSALSAVAAVREEGLECACLMSIVFRGDDSHLRRIKKDIPFYYLLDKDLLIKQFKELSV